MKAVKRPFACIGLGMLAALAAAAAFPSLCFSAGVICASSAAIVFAVSSTNGRKRAEAFAVLLAASAAFLYYGAAVSYYKAPTVNDYSGRTVEICGTITSEPFTSGHTTRFTVRTDMIDGVKKRRNISFAVSSVPKGGVYDHIRARAALEPVYTDGDIGLGYSSYSDARFIFLQTYIGYDKDTYYAVYENDFPPAAKRLADVRRAVSSAFAKYLSYDEASLCTAMITGDKNMLTSGVRSRFNTLGLGHLLVVSGLHLSIAAAFLYIAVGRIIKNRYAAIPVEFLGTAAFALMTGFGFSVRRAFLMYCLMLLARLFHSKTDPLNSLGFAAAVICISDPFCAGDIGLLWSFSSTLAIITLTKRIEKRLLGGDDSEEKAVSGIAAVISVSLAAFVGSLPFIFLVTKQFSPYFLAANILTVPITGIALFCGGIGAALICLGFVPFGSLLLFIAGLVSKYLLYITELLCSLPFSSVHTGRISVTVWFAATAVCLMILYLLRYFHGIDIAAHIRTVCVISLSILCAVFGADIFISSGRITLSILPFDGAVTVIMDYDDTAAVLFTGGDKNEFARLEDVLPQSGSIDFLIDLPCGGYDISRRILREYDVGAVITDEGYADKFAWYEYTGGAVDTIANEAAMSLFDNGAIELYTDGALSCEYITLNGKTVLIADGEGDIPERFSAPDIAVSYEALLLENIGGDTEKYICADDTTKQGKTIVF